MPFNYKLNFRKINFRTNPELYRTGKGEQGVLLVEPYKSEILPHWRFRTPELATQSSKKILSLFRKYGRENDYVGMDMARKFLQMGFPRARRYANHPSGRKFKAGANARVRRKLLPQAKDWKTNEKARSAQIFYEAYLKAKSDRRYLRLSEEHRRTVIKSVLRRPVMNKKEHAKKIGPRKKR